MWQICQGQIFIFNFWCTPPCLLATWGLSFFLCFVRNWGQAHVKKVHPFSVGGVHFWLWFALLVTWNSRFFVGHLKFKDMRPNGSQSLQHNTTYYYLSMKEGSLFVLFCFVLFFFVVMRSTEPPRCFKLCSWCLWKALHEEWCMGLVPWRLELQFKSSWILHDFFTEN